jgi:CcmD family protein
MAMIKFSFLTATLLFIVLNAAPFAGHALLPAHNGAAFAQAQSDLPANRNSAHPPVREKDEPADSAAVLYRVMGVVMVVWIGLAVFLFRLDRRLSRLEHDVKSMK